MPKRSGSSEQENQDESYWITTPQMKRRTTKHYGFGAET